MVERGSIGAILLVLNLAVILSGSRITLYLLILILSTLSILELFRCLDPVNRGRNRLFTVIANFFLQTGALLTSRELYLGTAVFFFMFLFMLSVVHKYREFEDLFLTLFIAIYISFFSSFAFFFPNDKQNYLLLVLCVAWGTDTFAYLSGFFFGRTPMTDISPKKTVEGAIGGTIGAVVLCLVLRPFFYPRFGMINTALVAVAGSVAAQLGDLFASRLKRKMGIKDFGTILRSHGGIMDRYDSIQFALPVVWLSYRLLVSFS